MVGPLEIADRRNELAGNLALDQELYFIRKVNELLARHRHRAHTTRLKM